MGQRDSNLDSAVGGGGALAGLVEWPGLSLDEGLPMQSLPSDVSPARTPVLPAEATHCMPGCGASQGGGGGPRPDSVAPVAPGAGAGPPSARRTAMGLWASSGAQAAQQAGVGGRAKAGHGTSPDTPRGHAPGRVQPPPALLPPLPAPISAVSALRGGARRLLSSHPPTPPGPSLRGLLPSGLCHLPPPGGRPRVLPVTQAVASVPGLLAGSQPACTCKHDRHTRTHTHTCAPTVRPVLRGRLSAQRTSLPGGRPLPSLRPA